jgi:hypothetical protein
LGRVCLLTPYVIKHWKDVEKQWSCHKVEALGVAIQGCNDVY